MNPAYLLGAGGALGAILRYSVSLWVTHDRFPLATLLVNVLGSFVLALLVFAGSPNEIALFVGTGVCGSFTTYSSFSFETVRLWETGERLRASIYALGTFGLCALAGALAVGLLAVLGAWT